MARLTIGKENSPSVFVIAPQVHAPDGLLATTWDERVDEDSSFASASICGSTNVIRDHVRSIVHYCILNATRRTRGLLWQLALSVLPVANAVRKLQSGRHVPCA